MARNEPEINWKNHVVNIRIQDKVFTVSSQSDPDMIYDPTKEYQVFLKHEPEEIAYANLNLENPKEVFDNIVNTLQVISTALHPVAPETNLEFDLSAIEKRQLHWRIDHTIAKLCEMYELYYGFEFRTINADVYAHMDILTKKFVEIEKQIQAHKSQMT